MKRIMVIDMCQQSLNLAGCYLERNGYEPIQIEDPFEAAMAILTEQPSVVILGGEELCYADLDLISMVRTWEQTAALPWILMTPNIQQAQQQVGTSVPIDGYLQKPVQERALIDMVQRVLSQPARQTKPGTVYLPPQNAFGEKSTGFWPREKKTRSLPPLNSRYYSALSEEGSVR